MKKAKKFWITGGVLFLLFVMFTIMLKVIDVKPSGISNKDVGFSQLNEWAFSFFGVHEIWDKIADLLLVIAILTACSFFCIAAIQLIKRKSVKKIDKELLAVGILYVIMIIFYVIFELVVINYRPILIDGIAEASYPSTHTLLVLTILASALPLNKYLTIHKIGKYIYISISISLMLISIVSRLLSGVHWLTDIIGSILLSGALIFIFIGTLKALENKNNTVNQVDNK